MNKTTLFTLLFLLAGLVQAQQQSDSVVVNNSSKKNTRKAVRMMPDEKNALKLNMLSPFYSNLSLFYQHVFNDENSLQLGYSYMDFSGFSGNNSPDVNAVSNEQTTMFTVTPEFRYNLNGRNLSGTYFGAFVRYVDMSYSYDSTGWIYPPTYPSIPAYYQTTRKDYHYTSAGIGILIGNQFLFKRKIVVDMYVGPVYSILMSSSIPVNNTNDIIISSDISNVFLKGYGIRAGFSVGFAF